jgi:hypothetical protein
MIFNYVFLIGDSSSSNDVPNPGSKPDKKFKKWSILIIFRRFLTIFDVIPANILQKHKKTPIIIQIGIIDVWQPSVYYPRPNTPFQHSPSCYQFADHIPTLFQQPCISLQRLFISLRDTGEHLWAQRNKSGRISNDYQLKSAQYYYQ